MRRLRTSNRVAALMMSAALVVGASMSHPAAAAPAEHPDVERLDQQALQTALDGVHDAGIHGVIGRLRVGRTTWKGASGVADVETGRAMRPHFEHRIGSITKAFTAVGILQQVAKGRIDLDAPVGRYLPDLMPGERGQRVTVRMLLDHTSGIGDIQEPLFPGMMTSLESVEKYRFRSLTPLQVARVGLAEPPTGEPGQSTSYSNTNYVIAGLLLERVTGQPAERYLTQHVIRRAGLRDTYFPGEDPWLHGPHSKAYFTIATGESGEFSVYNMTWASTAGSLVSTAEDLDRFGRALLGGRLLRPAELTQLKGGGFGFSQHEVGGCLVWSTAGAVIGMDAILLASEDGRRTFVYESNTQDFRPGVPEAVGQAVNALFQTAGDEGLCA